MSRFFFNYTIEPHSNSNTFIQFTLTNVASWEIKIQICFWSRCVRLDVFHAVQGITKTLPKRHVLHKQCAEKLRLVFRKDGDSGEKRISHTSSTPVMLQKMERFVEVWKDAKDQKGKRLFTSETFKAINKLKTHIVAGCLSNIPPGGGTNRNEQFHSHVKFFFHKSRIGIFLAYALLTVIIYSHNSALTTKGKRVVRPIAARYVTHKSPAYRHTPYRAAATPTDRWKQTLGDWRDWLPNGHGPGMVHLQHIVTENANQYISRKNETHKFERCCS